MGTIDDALREAFLTALSGREEISADLRKILGHSVKRGGLGIPYPWLSAECVYNTSKEASDVLIRLLLGGTDLNYIAHNGCACTASADDWKQ